MTLQFSPRIIHCLIFVVVSLSTRSASHAQQPLTEQEPTARIADNRTPLQPTATLPAPFQLSAEEQRRIDLILQHWENKTKHIRHFSCKFYRWEYQPQWAKDIWSQSVARTVSEGVIDHQTPDKANFQVTKFHVLQGKGNDGKPAYLAEKHLEHWICDGNKIYEYEPRQQHVIERRLPPEWQGKSILEGPLPFLFGAKAETLKTRYWIKELTPQVKDEIWLDIHPRNRQSAVNFQNVQVMLAASDFLPNGMRIVRHDGSSMTFSFFDRTANSRRMIPHVSGLWGGKYRPTIPAGWKRVVEDQTGPVTENKRRLLPR